MSSRGGPSGSGDSAIFSGQRQKKKPLVMRSCNAEYTRLASKLPRGDYGCGHTLPKNLEELKLMDFKEDLKCGFYR